MFITRDAMNASVEFNVFGSGKVGIDAEEIGHITNFALDHRGRSRHLLILKPDLPRCWSEGDDSRWKDVSAMFRRVRRLPASRLLASHRIFTARATKMTVTVSEISA